MPKTDGATVTWQVRQNEINTSRYSIIIAVTANALAGSQELCFKAGMDDIISKPPALVDINHVLVKCLKGC